MRNIFQEYPIQSLFVGGVFAIISILTINFISAGPKEDFFDVDNFEPEVLAEKFEEDHKVVIPKGIIKAAENVSRNIGNNENNDTNGTNDTNNTNDNSGINDTPDTNDTNATYDDVSYEYTSVVKSASYYPNGNFDVWSDFDGGNNGEDTSSLAKIGTGDTLEDSYLGLLFNGQLPNEGLVYKAEIVIPNKTETDQVETINVKAYGELDANPKTFNTSDHPSTRNLTSANTVVNEEVTFISGDELRIDVSNQVREMMEKLDLKNKMAFVVKGEGELNKALEFYNFRRTSEDNTFTKDDLPRLELSFIGEDALLPHDEVVKVTSEDGEASATVLPGTFDEDYFLVIEKLTKESSNNLIKKSIEFASNLYNFELYLESGENVTKFEQKILLEIKYVDLNIDTVPEDYIRFMTFDDTIKHYWETLDSEKDLENNLVKHYTSTFSTKAIGYYRDSALRPEPFLYWPVDNEYIAYDFVAYPDSNWAKNQYPCVRFQHERCYPDHQGTDISREYMFDETVYAAADGIVMEIHNTCYDKFNPNLPKGGSPGATCTTGTYGKGTYNFGNMVILKHTVYNPNIEGDDKMQDFYTFYAHLKQDSMTHLVKGQPVSVGQPIAQVGNTGESGGYHLHFQVSYSTAYDFVDPWGSHDSPFNKELWVREDDQIVLAKNSNKSVKLLYPENSSNIEAYEKSITFDWEDYKRLKDNPLGSLGTKSYELVVYKGSTRPQYDIDLLYKNTLEKPLGIGYAPSSDNVTLAELNLELGQTYSWEVVAEYKDVKDDDKDGDVSDFAKTSASKRSFTYGISKPELVSPDNEHVEFLNTLDDSKNPKINLVWKADNHYDYVLKVYFNYTPTSGKPQKLVKTISIPKESILNSGDLNYSLKKNDLNDYDYKDAESLTWEVQAIYDDGQINLTSEKANRIIKLNIPRSLDGIVGNTNQYGELVPLYRFFNSGSSNHFYTWIEDEKDGLLATNEFYIFEGIAGYVIKPVSTTQCPAGTYMIYRYYNNDLTKHFYGNATDSAVVAGEGFSPEPGGNFCVHEDWKDGTNEVVRFKNNQSNNYFFTQDSLEINKINASADWDIHPMSQGFYMYDRACSDQGVCPVYRFYIPINEAHFYTLDRGEVNIALGDLNADFEGSTFNAYNIRPTRLYHLCVDPDKTPLYRFWGQDTTSHFYTTDPDEVSQYRSGAMGNWKYEGTTMCVDSNQTTTNEAMYSFFRGNATPDNLLDNAYFFTSDPVEVQLIKDTPQWGFEIQYGGNPVFYVPK